MNYNNYYQQPFFPYGNSFNQGFYQQPMYPQYVYADNPYAYMNAYMNQQNQSSSPWQERIPEQSFVENILRMNIGKVATVYMNFEGSQWGSKVFKGTVLAAGKDHIIIKDLQSEMRYVLLTIYLCYVTFDEPIDYDYPYARKEAGS